MLRLRQMRKHSGEIARFKNYGASSLTELLALLRRRDIMLRVNDCVIEWQNLGCPSPNKRFLLEDGIELQSR